jgi:hypothetical protein
MAPEKSCLVATLRHCQVASWQCRIGTWQPGNVDRVLGCFRLSFVSALPSSCLKGAQRQQHPGGAVLGWQPGNVDFKPLSQAFDLHAEGFQGQSLELGRSRYRISSRPVRGLVQIRVTGCGGKLQYLIAASVALTPAVTCSSDTPSASAAATRSRFLFAYPAPCWPRVWAVRNA